MTKKSDKNKQKQAENDRGNQGMTADDITQDPVEKGGPKGPEPTRFGDWESNGRCTDF